MSSAVYTPTHTHMYRHTHTPVVRKEAHELRGVYIHIYPYIYIHTPVVREEAREQPELHRGKVLEDAADDDVAEDGDGARAG